MLILLSGLNSVPKPCRAMLCSETRAVESSLLYRISNRKSMKHCTYETCDVTWNRSCFREAGVARRSFVLVGEDLLASLASSHTILLLLASFRSSELLFFLRTFDLVAVPCQYWNVNLETGDLPHSIELLFLIVVLVRQPGSAALTLNPKSLLVIFG